MTTVLATDRPNADDELAAALVRILATTTCPLYLRRAAERWLAGRVTP